MEKFNRAERRAQIARLKAKRKSYWGKGSSYGTEGINRMDAQQLGMVVSCPQRCSCMGCGNQRRWVGPTFKELIQMEDLKEVTHVSSYVVN